MKMAHVYRLRDKYLVTSASQTDAGVWIGTDPIVTTELDAVSQLGEAVRDRLSESKFGIPHPIDFSSVGSSLLEAAGTESWSRFEDCAVFTSVESDETKIRVGAWTRVRGQEGHVPTPDDDVVLPANASAHEIGTAVVAVSARNKDNP